LLKQCLAEIDKRRGALQEAIYKQQKKYLKRKKLQKKIAKSDNELLKLRKEKLSSEIITTTLYIEGALKDIATQQENYEQIRKNNGIREDWDEADFEAAEPLFHTRRAFELLYSDLTTNGRMGKGSHEYLGQFGIHQQVALKEAEKYIKGVDDIMTIGKKEIDGGHLEKWLDAMAFKYSNCHKDVLERMGIDNMVSEFCQYKTRRINA
jgi:hypothetical protein